MIWLLPALMGSRAAHIIVVMTQVVALGEFAQIIAGSIECAYCHDLGVPCHFRMACSHWLLQVFSCSPGAHVAHTPPSNQLITMNSSSDPSWGSLS
jgi:hypothetical protein